ncbi:MAG: VOC family protein [Phycisphaerae bacterium]
MNDRASSSAMDQFRNSQEYLERQAPRLVQERRKAGLEGLVGDLACVIINVEPDRQKPAVEELQHYTGMRVVGVFEGPLYITAWLALDGSADILVRSRRKPDNPFRAMNDMPKSRHLPNTRLETFVMECLDLEKYVAIQKARGVRFVTEEIIRTDTYLFIQTLPSALIGASYGFIQWLGPRTYRFGERREIAWDIPAPTAAYRGNIGRLDHVATRVRARDRDDAILEFIRLTNHTFSFSIYVESLNSITNVTRRSAKDVGLVFTSGIAPYVDDNVSGPTEKFIHNYGPRTHHIAFATEDIERTFDALKADGMTFMIELVGGQSEGLHQTFTNPSPHTLIVSEYIHRYGGFTGYFTQSNVTALTLATGKQ